ncbi:hypothetical protein [Aliikangiella sp. G2MR2-5]|uniref:hypothetical protein n=1 Tax=Aliikangiella sp. G2MR2-5 TaxID=2788943 RepID=UPI0018AA471B|nr:hypothetical protein [Aliikangiella sp. G2MR2-5]
MKFHDYHMESYKVSNRGEKIELNLVYDYPGEETDDSQIIFNDVALYHFINTQGAIINDIEEVSLNRFIISLEKELSEWSRMYGVKFWQSDIASYIDELKSMGLRVWEITSAIGFYGFVIAKEVNSST